MLRVHRIPFSTNVERVALAAGLKGLSVEWVDHDPLDRGPIRALSGQDLFPVAELSDGRVLYDSPVILRALEELAPEPPLWPADPAARAVADVFMEWFNGVWKGPPNRIADGAERAGDREWFTASRDVFEGLLTDRRYLLGDRPGVADVLAYPFPDQRPEIPEQHAGPPAQTAQVQHCDRQTRGRPERARRTRQQQRLTANGKGVVAGSDPEHPGAVAHRASRQDEALPRNRLPRRNCAAARQDDLRTTILSGPGRKLPHAHVPANSCASLAQFGRSAQRRRAALTTGSRAAASSVSVRFRGRARAHQSRVTGLFGRNIVKFAVRQMRASRLGRRRRPLGTTSSHAAGPSPASCMGTAWALRPSRAAFPLTASALAIA
jgi:glutathione S-transferase